MNERKQEPSARSLRLPTHPECCSIQPSISLVSRIAVLSSWTVRRSVWQQRQLPCVTTKGSKLLNLDLLSIHATILWAQKQGFFRASILLSVVGCVESVVRTTAATASSSGREIPSQLARYERILRSTDSPAAAGTSAPPTNLPGCCLARFFFVIRRSHRAVDGTIGRTIATPGPGGTNAGGLCPRIVSLFGVCVRGHPLLPSHQVSALVVPAPHVVVVFRGTNDNDITASAPSRRPPLLWRNTASGGTDRVDVVVLDAIVRNVVVVLPRGAGLALSGLGTNRGSSQPGYGSYLTATVAAASPFMGPALVAAGTTTTRVGGTTAGVRSGGNILVPHHTSRHLRPSRRSSVRVVVVIVGGAHPTATAALALCLHLEPGGQTSGGGYTSIGPTAPVCSGRVGADPSHFCCHRGLGRTPPPGATTPELGCHAVPLGVDGPLCRNAPRNTPRERCGWAAKRGHCLAPPAATPPPRSPSPPRPPPPPSCSHPDEGISARPRRCHGPVGPSRTFVL